MDPERARQIMETARKNIANRAEVERDLARRLMALPVEDRLARYKREQNAEITRRAELRQQEQREAEDRRREREDRVAAIEAMVAAEIDRRIVDVYENVAAAFDQFANALCDKLAKEKELKAELATVRAKLTQVESMLRRTPKLPEREPIDLPSLRSVRESRNVN